jgi:hypothetical protein
MMITNDRWRVSVLVLLAALFNPVAAQARDLQATLSVTATVIQSCRAATNTSGLATSPDSSAVLTSKSLSVVCNHDVAWNSSIEAVVPETATSTEVAPEALASDAEAEPDTILTKTRVKPAD